VLNVVLGITGGIAAYKATAIIRGFTEAGHSVKVIPTQNALRFIGATTLEALSHNAVDPDLYTDVDSVKHVALGQEADLIVVAPASAAFLGRFAAGIADDLLLNTLLASKAPVLLAPAMHTEMWQNPATQANVATLRSRGISVLEPDTGRLTGSDTGPGRLPEPGAIVSTALSLAQLHSDTSYDVSALAGKHVLVTAGGTREAIDPVRYIGNHSSGKQGLAIAHAAKAAGARVTLVAANLQQVVSGIDDVIAVSTAKEMAAVIDEQLAKIDVLVMTAAVADFRLEFPQTQKIKRSDIGNALELKLVANPDILAEAVEFIGAQKLNCLTVGFAAETAGSLERLASLATMKLASKGCDLIVANDVSEGAVFGADHNTIYLLDQAGESAHATGTKQHVAGVIVGFIAQHLAATK
jgi:phosphopantothenoylcysteine decarboxylase/phosphopantothenate--cysteine ligase